MWSGGLNFQQLETLVALARLRNFHAVAQHLHTTQPSITQRLQRLEEELGAKLFERGGQGAALTAMGRECLIYAEYILSSQAEMRRRAGSRDVLRGRVSLGVSATAPPNYANLQANGTSMVPGGGTYSKGSNTTDLGAVSDPTGGSGARRLGATVANGANVYLGRSTPLNVAPATPYEFTLSARSNATAPTRGTLMTVDEFTGANWTGTLTRSYGPGLISAGVNGSWRSVTRRLTTRADTQSLQVYWAEGWQTGAEIEVWGASITRRPELIDTGRQAFSLTPLASGPGSAAPG